jgi:aromatic ring-opening dioxygenase catalytic subunit (LigB family)
VIKHYGPESPLANFLHDFGPALLAKYQPKGILVFSAHWETQEEQLGMSFSLYGGHFDAHPYRETVTDYGDENPLLMDYYNFDPELYKAQVQFAWRYDAFQACG